MQISRKISIPALAAVAALTLGGCESMDDTTRRTLTGTGVGAAAGGIIGSFSGNAGWGALIGAGAGAAGGYLFDRSRQNEQRAFESGYEQGRSSR
ncbi:YMGG-like glycine zipper-containing protein [Roseococcus sp. YIM B11640]|uniref:YMGG-like glycine zipper-containing protein n=1 Tax=Roseococcus sp. YIM B11640 TaxID=3133973 RepID=UPI003C7CFB2B